MSIFNTNILITGSAGFIGSYTAKYFNLFGFNNIYLLDDFSNPNKTKNWDTIQYKQKIDRHQFLTDIEQYNKIFHLIIHLGARTDTTEFNYSIHEELNVHYTQKLWHFAIKNNIPFIYASSAATYGDGAFGYLDNNQLATKLKPLNPYGKSKNEFDKWALIQSKQPKNWVGLKFFNVYGPNEYHKNRMASVIMHSFNQIKNTGQVKLFKSAKENIKNGEQLRDFVYVKNLAEVIYWMALEMLQQYWNINNNGLYNIGTGKARSFNDLVYAVFSSLNIPPKIEYIDIPLDIKEQYQYFTEANMNKLKSIGYNLPFDTLEQGVHDYVQNYLETHKYY